MGLHPAVAELQRLLDDRGVPREAYSLTGGSYEARDCLEPLPGGRWSVYYFERGERRAERFHSDVDRACADLLKRVTSP